MFIVPAQQNIGLQRSPMSRRNMSLLRSEIEFSIRSYKHLAAPQPELSLLRHHSPKAEF